MSIWAEVVEDVAEQLPKMNDYLISHFRQDKFYNLYSELDVVMRQMIHFVPDVEYLNYELLSPIEHLEYKLKKLKNSPRFSEKLNILDTRIRIVKFNFKAKIRSKINGVITEKEIYLSRYLYVPFLYQECLVIKGTKYFPIFNIMDSITRSKIKNSKKNTSNYQLLFLSTGVMLLEFEFSHKNLRKIVTLNKNKYQARMVTVKAHHKKKKYAPVLLYGIIKHGLRKVFHKIGFENQFIYLSKEPFIDPDFENILLPEKMGYLVVLQEYLFNIYKKRAIITVLNLVKIKPPESIDELFNQDRFYWKKLLGEYIHYDNTKPFQKMTQVIEHLKTCDRIIDKPEKVTLNQSNIYVDDFYELCIEMFFNIDRLFIFDQKDLFEKQIDVLKQFLFRFRISLNNNIFNRGMNEDESKTEKTILKIFDKRLLKNIHKLTNMFTHVNELCHDNWLLGPGCKKHRSKKLKNVDSENTEKSGALVDPMILAHPSQFYIESPLNLPSSKPCIGGSINVMFSGLNEDGTLSKPSCYKDFEDVFLSKESHDLSELIGDVDIENSDLPVENDYTEDNDDETTDEE